MKKEELIKKAAERGVTLTETQAEKYVAISDEELENVAGGLLCGFKREVTRAEQTRAETCPYFSRHYSHTTDFLCCRCNFYFDDGYPTVKHYCTKEEAW
ncbi:MAG: hypothetical protein LBL98_07960 [Ruminococcus sp.]|jgi:hypothetical protein|nr:hypothetical protein [Ruminococcus sp.]